MFQCLTWYSNLDFVLDNYTQSLYFTFMFIKYSMSFQYQ